MGEIRETHRILPGTTPDAIICWVRQGVCVCVCVCRWGGGGGGGGYICFGSIALCKVIYSTQSISTSLSVLCDQWSNVLGCVSAGSVKLLNTSDLPKRKPFVIVALPY